jgi:type II secretory pathway component PulJ
VTLALSIVALLSLVALVVTAPLGRTAAAGAVTDDRIAELEAAKEAKYREIRDARLDFGLGKVSVADHEATERELQAQALAIVREIETGCVKAQP